MKHGYLLMECMLATLLLAIGIGSLLSSMSSANRFIQDAKGQITAQTLCEAKMEELKYLWARGGIVGPTFSEPCTTTAVPFDNFLIATYAKNFVASYTISTESISVPLPSPNQIATLYRLDLEVVNIQNWASLSTLIPPQINISVHYTASSTEPRARLTTYLPQP